MNTTTTNPFGPGYADQIAHNAAYRRRQTSSDGARFKADRK